MVDSFGQKMRFRRVANLRFRRDKSRARLEHLRAGKTQVFRGRFAGAQTIGVTGGVSTLRPGANAAFRPARSVKVAHEIHLGENAGLRPATKVDYLVAPRRAYVKTPLLCAIKAKRDDFEAGERQCIAEMAVCRDNNIRDGHDTEIHGIVSNGQGWVFYRLTRLPEVWVSGLFTMNDLPKLLGALNHVCAACAANIP